jgi:hypothetical protein
MKYKVGDKVKVRQDLVEGEMYGCSQWIPAKSCKYIVVNKVNTNSYYAESNGRQWYYTDEMLDGLVDEPEEEPVEEPEKPTDAEMIAAAELLKANCKNQKDCQKCIFLSKVCCKFEYKTPEEWELPHLKTRKELLLEKFPDAKINGSGLPASCAQNLGLVSYCEALVVGGNCTACWNAPMESEEE